MELSILLIQMEPNQIDHECLNQNIVQWSVKVEKPVAMMHDMYEHRKEEKNRG